MPHTLLMPLVAPMQSWGYRSRFDTRDSAPEPTKSGVIGLLCAALGRPRSADISDLAALRFGVRTDRPGTLQSDYHTALDVVAASGGKNYGTVVSRRHYIADAWFLAGLESEESGLLETLLAALKNPVWPLFLGRKSFPLALPPWLEEDAIQRDTTLRQALESFPWLYPGSHQAEGTETLRISLESETGGPTATLMRDQPGSFQQRSFSPRTVESHFIQTDSLNPGEPLPCISRE